MPCPRKLGLSFVLCKPLCFDYGRSRFLGSAVTFLHVSILYIYVHCIASSAWTCHIALRRPITSYTQLTLLNAFTHRTDAEGTTTCICTRNMSPPPTPQQPRPRRFIESAACTHASSRDSSYLPAASHPEERYAAIQPPSPSIAHPAAVEAAEVAAHLLAHLQCHHHLLLLFLLPRRCASPSAPV